MADDDGLTAGVQSTYNPLLGSEQLGNKLEIARKLRSQPGVAQVLYRHGRVIRVLQPEDQLTVMEMTMSGCTSVARVDVRPHDLMLVGGLPCRAGAHDFGVIVRLTCRVSDPKEVAIGNIQDAGAKLHRAIFERMQEVSHEHGVDDVIRARTAVLEKLNSERLDQAFEVSGLSVELRLDDVVRELLRAELQREFFETVVRQGPESIAAWQLSKTPDDAQAALEILFAHRREQIEVRRAEERYLIETRVVRPEQLEEDALERLRRLEPPPGSPPPPPVAPFTHTHPDPPALEADEAEERDS
jgi:hypothetical protein